MHIYTNLHTCMQKCEANVCRRAARAQGTYILSRTHTHTHMHTHRDAMQVYVEELLELKTAFEMLQHNKLPANASLPPQSSLSLPAINVPAAYVSTHCAFRSTHTHTHTHTHTLYTHSRNKRLLYLSHTDVSPAM
jgi:hypothetical protein